MDFILNLRELRQYRGLSQADAAPKSGLAVKTLSSFETGERIDSMKLTQLQRLLRVYGVTEAEFFSAAIEHLRAPWEHETAEEIDTLICPLRSLPSSAQHVITDKLRLAIDLARDLTSTPASSRRQERAGVTSPLCTHSRCALAAVDQSRPRSSSATPHERRGRFSSAPPERESLCTVARTRSASMPIPCAGLSACSAAPARRPGNSSTRSCATTSTSAVVPCTPVGAAGDLDERAHRRHAPR